MDNKLTLTLLYDFYGELLTGKQRRFFEMYYMEDCSLGEVADNMGVSRQAVSDILARIRRKLHDYEKKVGFMAFYAECDRKGLLTQLDGDREAEEPGETGRAGWYNGI